jgi:hypothetical protein
MVLLGTGGGGEKKFGGKNQTFGPAFLHDSGCKNTITAQTREQFGHDKAAALWS